MSVLAWTAVWLVWGMFFVRAPLSLLHLVVVGVMLRGAR